MLASLVAMAAIVEGTNNGDIAGSLVLVTPAVTGLVVCYLGRRSDYYQGGCASSLVGAYVGLLTAVPAAFVGCQLAGDSGDACFAGAIVGLVVGMIAGPAVGATIGWHTSKDLRLDYVRSDEGPPTATTERTPPPSMALLDDSPTGRRASGQNGAGHVHLTVPLLSLAFR